MKELTREISESNSPNESKNSFFDPDKRVEVSERPVNGNFTDEDKAAKERGVPLL